MTISTVGVPNTIKMLASHKLQSTLAVRYIVKIWNLPCTLCSSLVFLFFERFFLVHVVLIPMHIASSYGTDLFCSMMFSRQQLFQSFASAYFSFCITFWNLKGNNKHTQLSLVFC
jgi:hypothetical protein